MLRTECVSKCAHYIRGVFILVWIVSAFLLSLLPAYAVYADSTPGGKLADPAVRTVDMAEPAVVRMITTIKGHLTVHFPPTSQVTFPQQDNGSYPLQISGTGTFITSQGDILTSDHVINPPKDKTLDQMLYAAAAQDVASYINQNAKQGSSPVTKDDVIQQLSSAQLPSTTAYDSPNSVVYLSTSYTGPLTETDLKSLPTGVSWQVDQIKKESSPDQQDLAVVHVPMHDAPSVQLANTSNIHDQGKVTVIGFPDNADMSQQPNSFLTPSVNTTSLSSQQANETAPLVTQAKSNAENGNYGGLAVDSQGNIVGIISSSSGSNGTSLSQENKNQRAIVNSLNLDSTPGQFQQLWNQAFQDYTSTAPQHWQKAQDDFNQLEVNYPNFKAVQPYLSYVQQQVQLELATATATTQSPTAVTQKHQSHNRIPVAIPTSFPPILVLIGGAIVLLLVLIPLLFTVIARRKRKSRSARATAQTATATATDTAVSSGEQTRQDSESRSNVESAPVQSNPPVGAASSPNTLVLKIWPCGHMNRPSARFCSMCGEAAPTPPGDPSTQLDNG